MRSPFRSTLQRVRPAVHTMVRALATAARDTSVELVALTLILPFCAWCVGYLGSAGDPQLGTLLALGTALFVPSAFVQGVATGGTGQPVDLTVRETVQISAVLYAAAIVGWAVYHAVPAGILHTPGETGRGVCAAAAVMFVWWGGMAALFPALPVPTFSSLRAEWARWRWMSLCLAVLFVVLLALDAFAMNRPVDLVNLKTWWSRVRRFLWVYGPVMITAACAALGVVRGCQALWRWVHRRRDR